MTDTKSTMESRTDAILGQSIEDSRDYYCNRRDVHRAIRSELSRFISELKEWAEENILDSEDLNEYLDSKRGEL